MSYVLIKINNKTIKTKLAHDEILDLENEN